MSINPKRVPFSHFQNFSIYYQGPDLSLGAKPAIFYFALSAERTLYEDPFNQIVKTLSADSIRVFSWDLPFHGKNLDPKESLYRWALEFQRNPQFMDLFIQDCQQALTELIEHNFVDPQQIGVAGVSRGSFVATALAACDSRIKAILGFAPLTRPKVLEEFPHLFSTVTTDHFGLMQMADGLVGKPLRFYIGNRDLRVGTDHCFAFIQHLVEVSYAKGVRSPPVELILYPSIGHKGHGTPPSIFENGANWLKTQLLY
jgi:esterase FrsA